MDNALSEILAFLDSQPSKLGTISTANADRQPSGAVVYYTFDKEGNIYLATRQGSRKYQNILQNPQVGFTVATEHPPKTVQIEGIAAPVTDATEQRELFPKLISQATASNFFPPIEQMDSSEVLFLKITPTRIRFGNFELFREGDMFKEVSK